MKQPSPRPPYQMLAVFAVLAAGIAVMAFHYDRTQRRSIEQEVKTQLLSIADGKMKRLSEWRARRQAEARLLTSNRMTIADLRRLMQGSAGDADRDDVRSWLDSVCRELNYAGATLFDARQRIVASSGAQFGSSTHLRTVAAEIMRQDHVTLSDFHRDGESGPIHLGLNVALRSGPGQPPFGALLVAIDPTRYLYPFLADWPVRSASAETLLVGRDGDDVLYLNDLRHRPDAAVRLRIPLPKPGLPAAMAVLGREGIVEGVDYRGVPVFAAIRHVPDSPWFLVAKVDIAEVRGPLARRSLLLGLVALALILGAAGGVAFLWRRGELATYRARHWAEETLRGVIDASPAAIISLDRDHRVTMWNRSAERIFGWTVDEVMGLTLPFVPTDRLEEARQYCERALAGQAISGQTAMRQRKDGTAAPVSLSAAPLRDDQGNIVGTVGILVDLSEQQKAEAALEESESRFRGMFDQAAVGMHQLSLDGRFIRVNRRFCEITGFTEQELLGQHFRQVVPADEWEEVETRLRRLLSGEDQISILQRRLVRRDGSAVWLRRAASVLRSSSGQPLSFIGVLEDITQQVAMEEALRQSEKRFRQVVEHAPAGIVVESDLVVRYMNEAAVRMFGLSSAAEMVGLSMLDRVHPEERAAVKQRSARVNGGGSSMVCERRFLQANGGTLMVECSAVSIEYDGQPAALLFCRDVGEKKRAEAERDRLQAELRQSQKMDSIGRLAGGVSHDFNNLLTVINGYCDMLLADLDAADPITDSLREVRGAGERAAALTSQLLAFSRKQIAAPKAIDLNALVTEESLLLRRLIGERITLETQLAPDLKCLLADPSQVQQVLMNLVVNARDAMPDGGRIRIETGIEEIGESEAAGHSGLKAGSFVVLTVRDTGVGMSGETLEKIFEPFFSTKPRNAGTGLGLSTVYGIVQHSGGFIRVASQLDRGSTFRIYLPATDLPADTSTEAPATGNLRGTETVMVVEDQSEVRKLAVSILRANGYRVLEAADGIEALSLGESFPEPIHVLLTDVMMPGMTGRELALRMARLRPNLKVLYMSGYSADVLAPHGVLGPGMICLPKPFTPAELLTRVRDTLGTTLSGRILVIDDDAAVCGLLDQILEDAGYQVAVAADGRAGMRKLAAEGCEVVITDLVMPGQEGLETIRQIRAKHPGIGIVAISGAFAGEFLQVAGYLGADYTLEKPVDRDRLLAAVRDLLSRPRPEPSPVAP